MLKVVRGLQDQPRGAKKSIGEEKSETRKETKGGDAVDSGADERCTLQIKSVDKGAEDNTLGVGCYVRPPCKRLVPERFSGLIRLEAKFK